MRPGLLVAIALLVLAGTAHGQARVSQLAPADGASVGRGEEIRFEVAADPSVTSVSVRVTSGRRVLAEGALHPEGDVWTGALSLDRPGTYRWRAEARGDGFTERTPARTFEVAAPRGGRTAPVPRRFGRRRNRASFHLSTRGIPASVGRVVSRRVRDRDLLIRRGVSWWPGPALPPADRLDLETVLLHEFGHFAGNRGHRRRCSGSPLTESAGRGEWWRTPRNWWQAGCAAT